jgi:hypothetical protein
MVVVTYLGYSELQGESPSFRTAAYLDDNVSSKGEGEALMPTWEELEAKNLRIGSSS